MQIEEPFPIVHKKLARGMVYVHTYANIWNEINGKTVSGGICRCFICLYNN